jgi:prepilin-type N-terminal cleavage/methylation domain-containing protein
MTNAERMTNAEKVAAARDRHSRFVVDSSFVICLPHRRRAKAGHSSFSAARAFTLIELIVVVTIITILAGLVLSTAGYARKKGARARAETEIAAMSAACESYKADNAVYVRGPAPTPMTVGSITIPANVTDTLDAQAYLDPTNATYGQASLYLYTQLSGDLTGSQQATGKSYFTFKPQMLSLDSNGKVTAIKDPFGNSYGYSTAQAANPGGSAGYNPTFDLWSTAGVAPSPTPAPPATQQNLWIKNW